MVGGQRIYMRAITHGRVMISYPVSGPAEMRDMARLIGEAADRIERHQTRGMN